MLVQIQFLLLAATAACSPQFGFLGGLGGGSGWKVQSKKRVSPLYRSDAIREIVKYGPLELYGKDASKGIGSLMAMDPKGQAGIVTLNEGICKGCTILSARFILTNEDGSEAHPTNGVYIHHFVSYDSRKSSSSPIMGCDGGFPGMGAPFIDRGEDSGKTDTTFTPLHGTSEAGYHMNSGSIVVQYDMVNYAPTTKKIYVNLEYEYKNGQKGKDAGHTLKSVTCSGAIPPRVDQSGPVTTTSMPMLVTSDATIIWARGHLHSGGVKMDMNINGKTICTSLPDYNSKGVITNMTLCPDQIPIRTGSYMTISAEYNLAKHKLRDSTSGSGGAQGKLFGSDVMGMFALSYNY